MMTLRRYGFWFLLAAAIIFPFAFYSSDMSARRELSMVERIVFAVTKPLEAVFSVFTSGLGETFRNYVQLRGAREEAMALRSENAELQVRLQLMRELELENGRLRKLLSFVDRQGLKFISGRVQNADPTFLFQSVRVDRGQSIGSMPGMGVLSADGVVGVVMRSGTSWSDVLLVTDPNSNLDVIVSRNRRRGIIEGTLGRKMRFKYLDQGSRIQPGDEVVTSGLSGPFPRGITVGKVVSTGYEGTAQTGDAPGLPPMEIEPAVEFGELSEALILLNLNHEVDVIRRVGGAEWMDKLMETASGRPASQ